MSCWMNPIPNRITGKKNGGRWVAVMPHGKKLFYIQNKYEEGGRKVKTPLGQRLVNMIFMIFFH